MAFVSGGFLPVDVRGTKLEENIHVADWCKLRTPFIVRFARVLLMRKVFLSQMRRYATWLEWARRIRTRSASAPTAASSPSRESIH